MDQQQWLNWRRSGIGASDAPTIMGVSPFKSWNQLLKEKLMGEVQEENDAMKRGKDLEPFALEWFMKETGYLLETQRCYTHPYHEWMRATVDGINEEEKILLEIKSCKSLHEEIPSHYWPQLQHQMAVLGYKKMFYLSFDGREGKILEAEKDDSYIETLIQKERAFWDIVQKGLKDMSQDDNWIHISSQLKELRSLMKTLSEEESFLVSQLILFADGINSHGNGVTLIKKNRKGSVDYKKIPELQGVDTSAYRRPDVSYWEADVKEVIA